MKSGIRSTGARAYRRVIAARALTYQGVSGLFRLRYTQVCQFSVVWHVVLDPMFSLLRSGQIILFAQLKKLSLEAWLSFSPKFKGLTGLIGG